MIKYSVKVETGSHQNNVKEQKMLTTIHKVLFKEFIATDTNSENIMPHNRFGGHLNN